MTARVSENKKNEINHQKIKIQELNTSISNKNSTQKKSI